MNNGIKVFDFSYDALGRRTRVTRPNGVTTSYSYDLADQLLNLSRSKMAATLSSFGYVYDRVGNRTTMNTLRSAVAGINPTLNYVERKVPGTKKGDREKMKRGEGKRGQATF